MARLAIRFGAIALGNVALGLSGTCAALAAQGPGVASGTATPFTQLAMALLVYGASVVLFGAALLVWGRGRLDQPRRQWQLIRGTMTVPLGRYSCT